VIFIINGRPTSFALGELKLGGLVFGGLGIEESFSKRFV